MAPPILPLKRSASGAQLEPLQPLPNRPAAPLDMFDSPAPRAYDRGRPADGCLPPCPATYVETPLTGPAAVVELPPYPAANTTLLDFDSAVLMGCDPATLLHLAQAIVFQTPEQAVEMAQWAQIEAANPNAMDAVIRQVFVKAVDYLIAQEAPPCAALRQALRSTNSQPQAFQLATALTHALSADHYVGHASLIRLLVDLEDNKSFKLLERYIPVLDDDELDTFLQQHRVTLAVSAIVLDQDAEDLTQEEPLHARVSRASMQGAQPARLALLVRHYSAAAPDGATIHGLLAPMLEEFRRHWPVATQQAAIDTIGPELQAGAQLMAEAAYRFTHEGDATALEVLGQWMCHGKRRDAAGLAHLCLFVEKIILGCFDAKRARMVWSLVGFLSSPIYWH